VKNINPLYILALLAITFLFALKSNFNLEEKINQARVANLEFEKEGKQLKQLKQNWGDKKGDISKIEAILNQKQLSQKISDKSQKGDIYKVSFASLSDKEADMLADKIFNSFLRIENFSFSSNDDQNISVVLEFGL